MKTRFIDMPVVNVGTGANLYAALDKILRYFSFNCISEDNFHSLFIHSKSND